MVLGRGGDGRLAVLFNRSGHEVSFVLPPRARQRWQGAAAGRLTWRRAASPSSPRCPAAPRRTAVTIAPLPLEARRPGP